jgi:histamine receptor H3
MVVFFITWAPYTIYTIIKSVKKGDIEVLSYEALTWFLWLKSAVNPVLYAFSSKRYRMKRSCRDRMVVGMSTTCVISAYHH